MFRQKPKECFAPDGSRAAFEQCLFSVLRFHHMKTFKVSVRYPAPLRIMQGFRHRIYVYNKASSAKRALRAARDELRQIQIASGKLTDRQPILEYYDEIEGWRLYQVMVPVIANPLRSEIVEELETIN